MEVHFSDIHPTVCMKNCDCYLLLLALALSPSPSLPPSRSFRIRFFCSREFEMGIAAAAAAAVVAVVVGAILFELLS